MKLFQQNSLLQSQYNDGDDNLAAIRISFDITGITSQCFHWLWLGLHGLIKWTIEGDKFRKKKVQTTPEGLWKDDVYKIKHTLMQVLMMAICFYI